MLSDFFILKMFSPSSVKYYVDWRENGMKVRKKELNWSKRLLIKSVVILSLFLNGKRNPPKNDLHSSEFGRQRG